MPDDRRLQNRALDIVVRESGGQVTTLGIAREPATGLLVRVPTEQELQELRGSEGLFALIPTDFASYRGMADG